MTKKIVFSIIIPAFNEEKTIVKCLKSVLSQDFDHGFEIIVVNNGSTDNTAKIVNQFKVQLINESKKGLILARNAGFKQAKGKYLVNLDADCLVSKDWLKKIYLNFQKDSRVVLVTGPYLCLNPGQKTDYLNLFLAFILDLLYQIFDRSFRYYGGNVAIKKSALEQIGGYDLRFSSSDQLSLLKRLEQIGGKTVFDKTLIGYSSPRRTRKRFLKWIFKEVLFLYVINNFYIKLGGKSLGVWEDIR